MVIETPMVQQMGKRGMKPDQTKRDKLARLRLQNPEATLQQLADSLGVSREAIRQMLKKLRLETVGYREYYCCETCGVRIHGFTTKGKYAPRFCSFTCLSMAHTAEVECSQCHTLFFISFSDLKARRRNNKLGLLFCSRECWGSYAGTHYGLCMHPENVRKGAKERKHDYDLVKYLADCGFTGLWIAGTLRIPQGSIYYILNSLKEKEGR